MQAYEYALREQPTRAVSKMVDVFDALELKASCQVILVVGIFYPRKVTSQIKHLSTWIHEPFVFNWQGR
jgi:hypothetical protein